MNDDRYTFQNLEEFEQKVRRRAREIAYLVVWDRTERTTDDTLGRFELTLHDALPYLEDAEELIDTAEDPEPELEAASEPIDLDPDDEPTEEVDPFREDATTEDADPDAEVDAARARRILGRDPGPADFAYAACIWLRQIAIGNLGGDPARRFRVKAYSPKGARVVETISFLCRDDEPDLLLPVAAAHAEPAMPELRMPTPTFDQVEVGSAQRGMKALGDYYAQWGQLVLGSVGQLQGVNDAMLARVHRDLQQSRDQVDQLVAAILDYKFAEAQMRDARSAADRSEDARTDLAKQALTQLGEAAKAFLAAKGLSPDMAETLNVLGQSPELVATLNDPDVRALMQDPGNLSLLAGMLKQAGQQARALREATTNPTPPATAG